jgi:hypothetical protein
MSIYGSMFPHGGGILLCLRLSSSEIRKSSDRLLAETWERAGQADVGVTPSKEA